MSWQLAAFALLGLALAVGFGWYERSRPDARVVALVATLAAFAALGRIAFAAVPNVKPTTDIVLISGYALGGGPGFVVGALAGLTSNFFFGQGPWTPWQMAAWGLTGVLGAGLAVITARRIGRWPLALMCGLIGFAFTAIQDVGDWVNYSDHSAAALGVYVGKGLGFDLIHAVGCFAFALAFGPALTRSIGRFAERLTVRWRTVDGTVLPVLALAFAVGAVALGPARADASGGRDPVSYLLAAQNRDGGLGSSPGASSSQLYAGWAALGLAAAGHNPVDVTRGGPSLLAYVRTGGEPDTGSLERTILVVRAAGASARSFGGRDLVAALLRRVRGDGSISEQVNLTAFGVLALRSAGVAPPATMTRWIAAQQGSDGGFSFASGGGSDADDTGAALEALGPGGPASARAAAFLRRHQNPDGGFPSEPGGESNAQSTAWAVQGLLAAGVDPASLHLRRAVSPVAFLGSLTAADGHIRYSRTSDQTPVWVTAQALMALDRRPLPLAPTPRATGTGSAPAQQPRRGVGTGAAAGHRVANSTGRAGHRGGAPHRGGTRRPHRGDRAETTRAPGLVDRLASGAGALTALIFAPVGI